MSFKDYSKKFDTVEEATNYVVETNSPAHVVVNGKELTLIPNDAYKKLTSSLEEDDVWYLGFLGSSEKHAVKGNGIPKLKGNK